MTTRIENINKELIEWAITRTGNTLGEFYAQNPEVESWIKGEKSPTVKQLENFTHKVHVPFGYMFLPKPPNETIPLPFFRTGKDSTQKVSLNVFHTVQIIQNRQNWLTEYLEELNFPELEFVGKFSTNVNYLDVVNDIRSILKLELDWASKHKTWEDALNYLTEKIEESGIIVTYNGIVGNNTRRVIDVKECRGFVLVNKRAPFLFINSVDAKAAQMFTIMHELAHVWLGKSAGFDNTNLLPANDPLELLCDKIAAEILVPEVDLRKKWKTITDHKDPDRVFKNLSRVFKVSPIVVGRRALDLKLVTFPKFIQFYNGYMDMFKARKSEQTSGGDFYATTKKRISLRFAAFVNNAVNENKLLYRDAYNLTNMKGETYDKFINKYLY